MSPPQREEDRAPTTLTIDDGLARTHCALDAPDFAITVTLAVRFVGAEKAPDVALASAYENYLGAIPDSVLCDVRAAANQRLRDAGYLATVEIPAQRLANGDAEMRIVFGRLTALRVRGEADRPRICACPEPLTQDEVFNTRRAQSPSGRRSARSGRKASLRPAAGVPGDLVGDIAVVRHRGSLDINLQNRRQIAGDTAAYCAACTT